MNPQALTAAGGSLYFSANDGAHGTQLWTIGGTTPGTAAMLTTANVSGGGVSPTNLAAVGGGLYFAGNDGVHGVAVVVEQRDGGRDGDGGRHQRDDDGERIEPDERRRDAVLHGVHHEHRVPGVAEQRDVGRDGDGHQPGTGGTTRAGRADGDGRQPVLHGAGRDAVAVADGDADDDADDHLGEPAGITYGTALSATQLDATASVPGTFAYRRPPAASRARGRTRCR